MKLLIIARPFVFYGGVEQATAGLVAALAAHGHEVEVLSAGPPSRIPGVRHRRFAVPRIPSTARLLVTAVAARLVVVAGRWDIVQSHERTLRQDVYRAGEGCHRAYLANVDTAGGRRLYHRLVLALERRIFAATPQIVAIARAGRDEIEAWYGVPGARLSVIYNGVDLERFHPRNREAFRTPTRQEAALPADTFVVLFVGSGFARKGLATAIEALAGLADRRSRLVVIGKGDATAYRALGERLGIGDRVMWLGPRQDTVRWYAASDLVVLPSRYEPFGNVYLEALASGIPVVASTAAGGAELIEPGANGAVVDPRDARALTAAIATIRDGAWKELSTASRRSAEPYTYAAQVAGFERVYGSLERRNHSRSLRTGG